MGIAFITAKAEKFKHQRDAAYEEQLAAENLFSGSPEKIEPKYRCKSVADELPKTGTRVLLLRAEGEIRVFHLNRLIGKVMAPDSSELGELMKQTNRDAIPATVVELRPISKTFVVQLLSNS